MLPSYRLQIQTETAQLFPNLTPREVETRAMLSTIVRRGG